MGWIKCYTSQRKVAKLDLEHEVEVRINVKTHETAICKTQKQVAVVVGPIVKSRDLRWVLDLRKKFHLVRLLVLYIVRENISFSRVWPDLDIAYENQFAKTTNCLHLKLLACEHTVLPHIFLVHINYDSFFLLKLFMNSIRPLESRY